MKPQTKGQLYSLIALLFLFHNDFWFWKTTQFIFGPSISLLYHIGFCHMVTLP